MGWIDFHWHARDGKQSEKDTVRNSLDLAEIAGGVALGVMPNTDPPLTTEELCRDYLALGKGHKVAMYVHGGLTGDPEQVKRLVEAQRSVEGICGMKAFWGRSTGDLSITERDDQYRVLQTLAQEGYTGVLVSHCEREEDMHTEFYVPESPITWSTLCRPEAAEVNSFKDILEMADDVGFGGTIHVAHVSTTDVVDQINEYDGPIRLSCGVTPHHVFFNYNKLKGPDGAWYKCNPPLRKPETQEGLLERLLDGRIKILESDHAPHTEADKANPMPSSGIISGPAWPYVINKLRVRGMSEDALNATVMGNAQKLYGLEMEDTSRRTQWEAVERIRQSYPHDPFKDF